MSRFSGHALPVGRGRLAFDNGKHGQGDRDEDNEQHREGRERHGKPASAPEPSLQLQQIRPCGYDDQCRPDKGNFKPGRGNTLKVLPRIRRSDT